MTRVFVSEYFQKVILNWAIAKPGVVYDDVVSLLACAILCHKHDCQTINILPDITLSICQLNQKKGTCMQKEEVFELSGSRMYEHKVSAVLSNLEIMCFSRNLAIYNH
jgi:hypothetical protein